MILYSTVLYYIMLHSSCYNVTMTMGPSGSGSHSDQLFLTSPRCFMKVWLLLNYCRGNDCYVNTCSCYILEGNATCWQKVFPQYTVLSSFDQTSKVVFICVRVLIQMNHSCKYLFYGCVSNMLAAISQDDTHTHTLDRLKHTQSRLEECECRQSTPGRAALRRLFIGSQLAPDWLRPVRRQRGGTAAEAERPFGPDSCVCPQ